MLARLTGHSPLIQNVDFPAPMTNLATSSYKNTSGASSNRGSHFLLCMILYVDSSWGREKSSENSFETQCRKSPRVFLLGVVFGRRLTGGWLVNLANTVVFCIKLYEAIKFRMCQKSAFFEMFCLPKTCHGGCVGRIVLCTILAWNSVFLLVCHGGVCRKDRIVSKFRMKRCVFCETSGRTKPSSRRSMGGTELRFPRKRPYYLTPSEDGRHQILHISCNDRSA